MTIQGWLEILVTLCLVVVAANPIGAFMADVFEARRTFLSPALREAVTTGIAILLGRLAHAVPILAIAGSLAIKKKAAPSPGRLPTDGPLFIAFLIGVVAIITLFAVPPRRRAGTDRRALLLSARRRVLTSARRFSLGLVGSKPRNEFVIRARIAEAHLRHRLVAEPCPPLDDEARSADGQAEGGNDRPRGACGADPMFRDRPGNAGNQPRTRRDPAEIFVRGVGDDGEVDELILVAEWPVLRVMANFYRENARVSVDCDALAVGPSSARRLLSRRISNA